ncbi:DUF1697 domain-containing protein [Nocardia sp. CNY236]|uniref:DUF1697 domain-containing protein n=1 Tax=Nocardia sp. CNY236 TaxID=1169152 RepID=UPI0004101865|nr:DUF1697 domain-containing protein [Nocardia sp. CNY236]
MNTYAVLLRGINVGGKNKVLMADLIRCLEGLGFTDVSTLIASGNVVLRSDLNPDDIAGRIEAALPESFDLHDALIKVRVLSRNQFHSVVDNKPTGFGEHPETYHSDAIFLMGIDSVQATSVFSPRDGVDRVWPGDGVIYAQRLSSQRTKSRLGQIAGTPEYRSMTIRSWNTTMKLRALLDRVHGSRTAPSTTPDGTALT